MRNTFLLEELILESRLDDVIKKYPDVSKEAIEGLSRLDPSGNNKYLDWMVYGKKLGISQDRIVKGVNSFHKNVNKLNKEFLDELIKEKKWEWLLTDNSPIGKIFQNIYKNPKDINAYRDYGMALEIFKNVDEQLSKSEIKKLEANVLYNDSNLLILIPKSHRASCFYGSGTKWCTTTKDSDNYFKRYTSQGTLIYVINKKELGTNPWYKVAFLIKNEGDVQAFDAPDNPTSIEKAAENLGSKWDKIKDVIIEYLYQNKLKGIENFYVGQDLIAWLESKGLDPLKSLSSEELIKKIGLDAIVNYLKKRNISIFEFFSFSELINLYKGGWDDIIKKIWDGYKSVGINPLTKMFVGHHYDYLLTAVSNGTPSLDEFLNASSDSSFKKFLQDQYKTDNIFSLLNRNYGSKRADDWWGSRIGQKLMELFKDVDLIFGYAKSIGVNLFEVIDVRGMSLLLKEKFPMESSDPNETISDNRLKYILNNIEYLKGSLENYGFPTQRVLEYLGSIEGGDKIFNELLSKNLITNLSLKSLISFYKNPKRAFTKYLKDKHNDEDDLKYTINEILEVVNGDIKEVFSSVEEHDAFIKDYFKQEWDSYSLSPKVLFNSFFEHDYYQLYLNYKKRNLLSDLNILIFIKAYQDAPVKEETGLRELVISMATELLKAETSRGLLYSEGKSDYVAFNDIERLGGFFGGEHDVYKILEGDLKGLIEDFGHYGNLEELYYFLDNEEVKREIIEFLLDNYREKKVTLNLDWVDEFDNWAENIGENKFDIILYDERIQGMSDFQLQSLIEHSPELRPLKKVIVKSYNTAYNNLGTENLKNHVMSMIEEVFGGDFVRQKEMTTKVRGRDLKEMVSVFRYDYLMDDIEAYADEFVWYEDDLPNSVYNLISYLMDQKVGRFDGYLKFSPDDLDIFFDSWEPNRESFVEEFLNVLYDSLKKLSEQE